MTVTGDAGAAVLDYPSSGSRPPGPNARQALAHTLEVEELLYGGAAGGGKTEWVIAEVLAVLFEFPGSNGAIFRRTYPQLSELGGIELRLMDRIPRNVGEYHRQTHVWTFRNGSRLRLAHCLRDADVTKYQGAEFAVIAFDQVEQFTEYQFRYLLHRLRVSGELAERMAAAGYRPKAIATANPGGVGHAWVKRRWIDPFPLGEQPFRPAPDEDDPNPSVRCFVPATVRDNAENLDPDYVARLERLPEDDRRAMLLGDWSVFTGQRFRTFRAQRPPRGHVIDPEDLPLALGGITRALGVDYGVDAPFCALWGAKLADDLVVVYRELYQAGLTSTQQAELIRASEARGERRAGRPIPTYLDPACWARGHNAAVSPKARPQDPNYAPAGSIARAYTDAGVPPRRANNDRLTGVNVVAEALRYRPDGLPRLLIYSTCRNLIRTLPSLVRDPQRPEDVDTDGEDHAYDALRYLLLGLLRAPVIESRDTRRRREASGDRRDDISIGPTDTGDILRRGL